MSPGTGVGVETGGKEVTNTCDVAMSLTEWQSGSDLNLGLVTNTWEAYICAVSALFSFFFNLEG